jgi:hypothetical protein
MPFQAEKVDIFEEKVIRQADGVNMEGARS